MEPKPIRLVDSCFAFKKSFKYSRAKLWNSLSQEAKVAQSEYIFKQNIN